MGVKLNGDRCHTALDDDPVTSALAGQAHFNHCAMIVALRGCALAAGLGCRQNEEGCNGESARDRRLSAWHGISRVRG